jgi:hypothetical protein
MRLFKKPVFSLSCCKKHWRRTLAAYPPRQPLKRAFCRMTGTGVFMSERFARVIFLGTITFAAAVFPLAAQDGDSEVEEIDGIEAPEEEDGYWDDEEEDGNAGLPTTPDWNFMPASSYTRGDQTFNISMGVILPLFFTSTSGEALVNNVYTGGTGSLSYNYFLNSRMFLGGILQGSFSQTLGKNFLYLIPIGVTFGYQFVLRRFEFPLSITAGGMTQQYLTYNGYWLFLKPEASGFFRFSSDWSFGINLAWWLVPQWNTNIPEKDATGNFLEITLSARYHF